MLEEMISQHLESNVIVYGAAISACDKASQWQNAVALLRNLHDERHAASLVCCSAAMSACARGQQWEFALRLLAETQAAGLEVDVIMFSAGISACCGNWSLALEFLRTMRQSKSMPDISTMSSVIRSCGLAAAWQDALQVFQQIREDHLLPDVIAYHSTVSACEEAAQWEAAVQLLAELRLSTLRLDAQILSSAVSAAAKCGEWEIALSLLRCGAKIDTAVCNAAITACGKGFRWELALSLLPSDYVGYCAAISACEKGFEWQKAVALFEEMLSNEMQPDNFAYNALITCFDRCQEWLRALTWLEMANGYADEATLNAALDALASSGQWERLLELLEASPMKIPGWPNLDSFRTAMLACYREPSTEAWLSCLQLMDEMQKRQLNPGTSEYACAARACGRGSQWLKAFDLSGPDFEEEISNAMTWSVSLRKSRETGGVRWS